MTVYLTATTRPAWSQRVMSDDVRAAEIERRMLAIAERDIQRTTIPWFEVVAVNDAGERARLIVDRAALFFHRYETAS